MATITVRLDNFDGVNNQLYVVVALDGSNLTGSWSKVSDTLGGDPPFPQPKAGEGIYRWDEGGTSLLFNGAVVCELRECSPGALADSPDDNGHPVGYLSLPYATAEWTQQA